MWLGFVSRYNMVTTKGRHVKRLLSLYKMSEDKKSFSKIVLVVWVSLRKTIFCYFKKVSLLLQRIKWYQMRKIDFYVMKFVLMIVYVRSANKTLNERIYIYICIHNSKLIFSLKLTLSLVVNLWKLNNDYTSGNFTCLTL